MKTSFLGTSMAFILGSAASLAQANVFEFNPVNFGGTDDTFVGNELVGQFSNLFTSTDQFETFSATGWFNVNTINLNSNAQPTGGLDTNDPNNGVGLYDLWFEYTYEASGGIAGQIAPSYTIDSVSLNLYAGSGTDRDFILATDPGGPAVVTNSGTSTLIGSSTQILGGGIINFQHQSFAAVDMDFQLEDLGTFFTAPDPFFNLAFQAASTVIPTLDFDTGTGTLTGTTEIRFERVPEPTSLALLGLGMLALGWTASRRRQAS